MTTVKLAAGIFSLFLLLPAMAAEAATPTGTVKLAVPFVVEIPDGVWAPPWNNACEEASIVMVEQYYLGKTKISKVESKKLMWPLFLFQDKLYGSNRDADAARTQKIINGATTFRAVIKDDPTLADIKAELDALRPVITLHYGWDLKNPALRFRRAGSSFHMLVVIGYDDAKKQFITNDPGNENGLDFRYDYDIFLASLHDFNNKTRKADGRPRALFTNFETLVKSKDKNAIFLVKDGKKQYITHPKLFKIHDWRWTDIKIWPKEKIMALPTGEAIVE